MKLVYVKNKNGDWLMPCSPAKARRLLESNKAKSIKRVPFTIQLSWDCESFVQKVRIGIDKGSHITGFSAIANNQILMSGYIHHRTNIKKKMADRSNNRRRRRHKLWYREARFLNRASSKRAKRLPVSFSTNAEEIIRVLKKMPLPVSDLTIEDVKIDIKKLYGKTLSSNLRMACLLRDHFTCKQCQKQNCKLQVHHIQYLSKGGANVLENLTSLCPSCHKDVHSGKKKLKAMGSSSFLRRIADRTTRNKCYLYSQLKGMFSFDTVFGYQTADYRHILQLPKTHDVDALCIATLQKNEIVDYNKDNFYNIHFRAKQTRRKYLDQPKKGIGRKKYQVNKELDGFFKGDIVLVRDKFLKQVDSILSNGVLAFKRVIGEPTASVTRKCRLIEKRPTLIFAT